MHDEVVRRAQAGDQAAFYELYRSNKGAVRAIAHQMLRGAQARSMDIEDLCQEVFLLAFTRIGSFDGNSRFRTWISSIAHNQCLMAQRKARQLTNGDHYLADLDTNLPDDTDGLLDRCVFVQEDRSLQAIPIRIDLERNLRGLRTRDLTLLRRMYVNGESCKETATRLGITICAVKCRAHQAKRRAVRLLSRG